LTLGPKIFDFSQIFDSVSGSGSERKLKILPESTPVLQIRSHLCSPPT